MPLWVLAYKDRVPICRQHCSTIEEEKFLNSGTRALHIQEADIEAFHTSMSDVMLSLLLRSGSP